MPVKLEGKARLFNASGIAASYVYLLDSAFSPLEKQAAARAVLRYNQHTTNHSETRTDGGLHPMYLQLHGLGSASEQELKENKRLLEASQSDLFDAISTLDRIDGGISVLLRCPGFKPSEGSGAEHMTIDTYISPHELKAGGKDLTKHIALLVQSFGADIALPHLHRFEARCAVEGVRPPSVPVPGNELMIDGSSYLPPPVIKGGPHFCCRCRPAGTYAQDIAIHSQPLGQPPISSFNPLSSGLRPVKFQPKTAVSKSAKVANDDIDIDNDPGWLKEAVVEASKYDTPLPVIKAPRKSAADGFQGAIISLGPHTDAALDRFGLEDSLVPRLRILTRTIRDTQWERTLRTTQWGLSYEQAVNLANAMQRDIKAQQVQPVQSSMSWGTFVFSLFFLALLAVMFAYLGLFLF